MLLVIDILSYALKRKGWSRFASTLLLFFSQIIVSEFILGLFSILNSTALIVLNIILSSCVLFLIYQKFGKQTFHKYLYDGKKSVGICVSEIKNDPLWLVLIFFAILLLVWIIFLGVIFPATDFDGNSYHLTFIGNVIQNGNFFDTATSLPWLTGYPKGGEFLQMWSVLITRSDVFSDLTQIPFLLLGMYALYEISVQLGAKKRNARFAALLFLFLPIVLNQLKTTYVDVMLTTLYFAAIALILKDKIRKLDFVLVGIILSLLIAIKSTGFLFVATLAPLILWKLYISRRKQPKQFTNNYIKPILLMVTPMVFGLYWYIKNFVVYDTPIYPFGFKLLGKSIFPGQTFQEFAANAVSGNTSLPQGCVQKIWFVWTEQKDWFGCFYNYDSNYTGFGPIWFVILLPALIVSLYIAIKKKNYTFLAISALTAGLFAIYPANYYSRYTIFIAGVGILALSLTLSSINSAFVRFVKLFCLALAVFVIATNFVLCNYTPLVIKDQVKSLWHGSERGTIYNNNPGRAYVFLENKVKANDIVAYDSKPYFIYPLWKPDYSNDVIYLPATSQEQWLQAISDKSVDYVFTVVYSKENDWADGKLESIYKDDLYEVFKVN